MYWIKYAQRDLHAQIKNGELKQFSPFVDKGIIRVGGRLSKAIVTYDCKHPVMLPYKRWISLSITRQQCRNNRKDSKEVLDSTSAQFGKESEARMRILPNNRAHVRIAVNGRFAKATTDTADAAILLYVL